ncbi:DUF1176 domain-containing protein [uncultured Psychrobacter sp.]|uniref:DUF1176 domain-containing protein n=1 Tax=uncultured Psychrobacter sp. TaxID=259303 RepID=UPI00262C2F41|nr:DUF1176 domain-containing protein [uncultured Psychrobacter sp.]
MKGLFYKPIQSNMTAGNNSMKYKNNKNKLARTNSISRDQAFSGLSLKSIFSTKKIVSSTLLAISAIAICSTSSAAVELTHQDWQVACDNTRTCRLAGYQAESSKSPISVLLMRRAGSDANVMGKVKIGGAKESSTKALLQLGNRHRMSLFIDDKDLGETKPFSTVAGDAELTAAQVTALLEALTKSSKIELVMRNSRWQLSDKGAMAVMLKADEAQGRVGTPSALVSTNGASKSNSSVLPPKPAPQLRLVVPNIRATSSRKEKFSMKPSQLSALTKGTIANVDTDCPNLMDKSPWRISRLNGSQLLIQHNCWMGAYNAGTGMWVMNDKKPYDPVLITTEATDYANGKISSVQKGRGIGDCLNKTDWIWTGKSFVKSHESSTGLCRMIEAGGAWQLPTYVSEVNTLR